MRSAARVFVSSLTALFYAGPLLSASITWADPAGLCAGNVPCFTSVADAVANAGPAPAEVFLLPGTYPESVDLGTMGSALGGTAGELAVVSVDAAGVPTPGAVIDPGAPSGPGTGDALFAAAFPELLTLRGIVARSPDANGVFLTGGIAEVRLVDLQANGSAMGNGVVVANTDGAVLMQGCEARLNFNAGFNLSSQAGQVTVTDSVAERNDGAGFALVGEVVQVTSSQATANGDDGWVVLPPSSSATLSMSGVQSSNNGGEGIMGALQIDFWRAVTLSGVVATGNLGAGALLITDQLQANGYSALDNGNDGIRAAADAATIEQLTVQRNGQSGAFLIATASVSVSGALVTDNLDGGLLLLAGDDTGFASISGVSALRNQGTGVGVGFVQGGTFTTTNLTDVTAAENSEDGVLLFGGSVSAQMMNTTNNGEGGFVALADTASVASVQSSGNSDFGIGIGALEVSLADSSALGNDTGVFLVAETVDLARVTATANGLGNGSPGSGTGFVLLGGREIAVTDSLSDTNDSGWIFDVGAPGPIVQQHLSQSPRHLSNFSRRFGATSQAVLGSAASRSSSSPPEYRVSVRNSRTVGNTQASMMATLADETEFRVNCSDFVANGPSGFELLTPHQVDARYNYWGSATGPTHPLNPLGVGDAISDGLGGASGSVEFSPFLDSPAGVSDCPVVAIEVPAVPPLGLAFLACVLGLCGLVVLRPGRS